MRIGIVGGLDRAEPLYRRLAAQHGHEIETHHGHSSSRGGANLGALVSRVDYLVVVTEPNSHWAVREARALARDSGVPLLLTRRLGASTFAELLTSLAPAHAA